MEHPRRPNWTLVVAAASVLLAAAVVPALRLPAFIAFAVAVAAAWAWRRRVPLELIAVLPVAMVLSWPAWLGADVPLGPADCGEPLTTIALRRAVVAGAVGLLVLLLVRRLGIPPSVLGLRAPDRLAVALSVVGGLALAIGGLVIGPALAEPFFGRLAFERPVAAIAPALVFGVSNGVLEELAYRSVLQGLLAVTLGRRPAILIQAAVFGMSHVGPEVTDLVPVHAFLLGAAGLVAGLIVDRTRSLAIPIGVHVGADIALYFGLACRLPAA